MKLFTIGDSISQGFMSLAAARTELSYSTLLARSLGLVPGTRAYPLPLWGGGGLPLNIESLLRTLQRKYGTNIFGPIEWPMAMATINEFIDDIEDYYERGAGNIALPQSGGQTFFPNVSVAGFTVADAWIVTPGWCMDRIANDTEERRDGIFALPNRAFERTAHAVLNPSRDPAFNDYSQLKWLKHHHTNEGVENLILWLGSNNALGTIVRMDVRPTAGGEHPLEMTYDKRNARNLWSNEHFEDEYAELLRQTHAILQNGRCDCTVFVGTVPPVTVAPLARGVGGEQRVDDPFGALGKAVYFDRYTYFMFDMDFARRTGRSLSRETVIGIDTAIAGYNESIRKLVDRYNAMPTPAGKKTVRYVIVDIADQLLRLAYKRNNGNPTYQLPTELAQNAARTGRPVNTVYYHVERSGRMASGGVFSLDGVHPTAIGHGLIAHEFRNAMQTEKVVFAQPIDWNAVIASDSLYSNPIGLMPELYDNTRIAEMVLDLLRLP